MENMELETDYTERKFATYLTSNPFLYDYLFHCGLKPIEQTVSVTGRITWEYECTDELRISIQKFRINQNDKEA